MVRVLILQHAEGEWIGSMNDWFSEPSRVSGFTLTTIRLDHGEALPGRNSFDWLLIMGGPMSVNDESDYPWLCEEKQLIRQSIADNKTIIGICLGGQLIASAAGAEVYRNSAVEIGWFPVIRTDTDVTWLPETASLLSWHGDCFRLPAGARPFAASRITPCQGFSLGPRVWALQFHLEAQPGTVEAFLALEPHGLPEGKYVQPQQQLLSEAFLSRSQTIMHGLLDSLV
ncbi:GMP synthase-Glutamine amidotransferase [Amphritea atlantica]|uniref:GMP synthase-Glutamine amidotransferase n=1 Tax=Amphritea atlantica TaxID=355243 RepID=A0A1H9D7P3_9GAMM|nr:type 1 glutamine amidotransferase [Amphritea atlantica]SEQ09367.1 GMP synthase-Glutamine amidotransferase [Amphritea atlantica]